MAISTPASLYIYTKGDSFSLQHSILLPLTQVEIGEGVVIAGVNNEVYVYSTDNGDLLQRIVVCEGNGTLSLAMGADGGMFVVGTFSDTVQTYRALNDTHFYLADTMERPVSCERIVYIS
jgi:hypothetical protein